MQGGATEIQDGNEVTKSEVVRVDEGATIILCDENKSRTVLLLGEGFNTKFF